MTRSRSRAQRPAPADGADASALGVVAIGRNEGELLRVCLESVGRSGAPRVYVDSGSTDGSLALARALGAEVVELDLSIPFTAARARNAGFERLIALSPELEFVQFIDGDCELVADWIERALSALRAEPEVAVVCGRRRERHPERSIYNRLCDLEWDTPVGPTDACGGDALVRVDAFREVGGYDAELIAGEEPELCFRLRRRGHRILRIDAEMTIHDAAMTRFSQWWNRTRRAGHAAAEHVWIHRSEGPSRYGKAVRSAAFWGGVLPLATAAGVLVALLRSAPCAALAIVLAAIAGYALMLARVHLRARRRGLAGRDAALHAGACMLGKLPEFLGQLLLLRNRLGRRRSRLIEYRLAERDR